MNDSWANALSYEKFMGRWSILAAQKFLDWLSIPPGKIILDVGCGTGSLTLMVLENFKPSSIVAVDSSADFISYAESSINKPHVHFRVGNAQSLELDSDSIDVVVSGLVLNFIPKPEDAISEMIRVTKPGGQIGIFVWDYARGMQMLRFFWDAAAELDKNASELDEAVRFPICSLDELDNLFRSAGLKNIETSSIEFDTEFNSFNDYWDPFLSKVGPAPGYVMNISLEHRQKLKNKIRENLPTDSKGIIRLKAKAFAIKAIV